MSQEGVSASYKFMQKIWNLNNKIINNKKSNSNSDDIKLNKLLNKTIYNITKNLDKFQYNVVIANFHEAYNTLDRLVLKNTISNKTLEDVWKKILTLLMPIVPHLAYECWEKMTSSNNIDSIVWPAYDLEFLKDEECLIVIQVDGKKRGILKFPINSSEKLVLNEAKKIENVIKNIKDKTIVRNIFIKNKLVNFITKK